MEDKLRFYRRPLKDSSAIVKYCFLFNSVGYLKGHPRKLLPLFGTAYLTGKLLYFDNGKLMYLLMASAQGYFYCKC